MILCKDCSQLFFCDMYEDHQACDAFDRGKPDEQAEMGEDARTVRELWASIALLNTSLAALERKVSDVLAAVVRASTDSQ